MSSISLLDCTLRDGGYVNDWKFGYSNLVSIFERLVDSNVDIIEIGFLDDRRPFDIDRSIMPDTASVERIFGALDRKQAMIVGMVDYGTCRIENFQPCEDSFLDGIRVIFKKQLMIPAMKFCKELKSLGYKVFSQLVSVTTYSDEELMDLISLVNEVKPYAVSMVDTYGLLHPEDLIHYYDILDKNVLPEVQIGFHAHNNFQLAYANALAFLGKEREHDIVVDGTLYGMGKSAGNAPLELLAMRMNEKYNKSYNISPMLEAINESVMSFYAKSPWGYKTFFYLCASNECHPNYVSFFKEKDNLSISKINMLLSEITPEEKKLLYDKLVAEKVYDDYLNGKGNDTSGKADFAKAVNGRKILLVGPGKNIILQNDKVNDFIVREEPYVVSINYIPDGMAVDCVFVTKSSRYHDMTIPLLKASGKIRLLATSNIECRNGSFDFVVNRVPLLDEDDKYSDNSFLMMLRLLHSLGLSEIYCAGFDGYSATEDNYFNPLMEYSFVKQEAVYLNHHVRDVIDEYRKDMKISFITYSAYDVVEDINGASI